MVIFAALSLQNLSNRIYRSNSQVICIPCAQEHSLSVERLPFMDSVAHTCRKNLTNITICVDTCIFIYMQSPKGKHVITLISIFNLPSRNIAKSERIAPKRCTTFLREQVRYHTPAFWGLYMYNNTSKSY